MHCFQYINCLIASVSVAWIAPAVVALYSAGYLFSSSIRRFVTGHPGLIAENLESGATASITVFTLIIATVAILATFGAGKLGQNLRIGYEWLAVAMLSSLAQFLLTRQVSPLTSYAAVAATDSLWWSLTWSIWALYQAVLPDEGWTVILAIAALAVAFMSIVNVRSMARAGRTT